MDSRFTRADLLFVLKKVELACAHECRQFWADKDSEDYEICKELESQGCIRLYSDEDDNNTRWVLA